MERPLLKRGSSWKVLCPKSQLWRVVGNCYLCPFYRGRRDNKATCVYKEEK